MNIERKQIVVGITGASGAAYAIRLVQCLCDADVDVHLVASPNGKRLLDDELGIKEIEPQNDAEWTALAAQAAALVESGNLLLMGDRLVDNGDWVTMTRAMIEKGQLAIKAAQARDKDGILDAGSYINETCDNCYAKYQRQ